MQSKRRCCTYNDYKRTSAKSIQEFTDLYSGTDFVIHYKYAYILNVCFTAFIFGPMLPFMFVIAFCSLVVLYITERLCMAYAYRVPPNYDSEINDKVTSFLKYAPILFVLSSVWTFSNVQVFTMQPVSFANSKDASVSLFPPSDREFRHFFTTPACVWAVLIILIVLYFVDYVMDWRLYSRLGQNCAAIVEWPRVRHCLEYILIMDKEVTKDEALFKAE